MYIILSTSSGSRSSITAGFSGYTIEEFIKRINTSDIYGTLRYINLTKGSGSENKLSTMELPEFRDVFTNNGQCLLTFEQVDKMFNKRVQKDYGSLSKYKNTQRIPKKDLVVGNIYRDEKDCDVLYCGKVSVEYNSSYSGKEEKEGILFVEISDQQTFQLDGEYRNSIINDGWMYSNSLKKTNSVRLMVDTGLNVNLGKSLSGYSRDGRRNIKIDFLEV